MANAQAVKAVSLVAGEDLRGGYAAALTINSSGQVVQPATIVPERTGDAEPTAAQLTAARATATAVIVGALAEEPAVDRATTGSAVPVALVGGGGVLKMKAGADITAGQLVIQALTGGRVAGAADVGALVADQMAVGVALESAADGDIFSVLAQTIAAPHSA